MTATRDPRGETIDDARLAPTAAALTRAHELAVEWLRTLPDRPVPPRAGVEALRAQLGGPLPEAGEDPVAVIEALGGRGGARTHRVGRAAVLRVRHRRLVAGGARRRLADERLGPERRAVRDRAGRRRGRGGRRRLAHRPVRAARGHVSVGFTTGATMATFTGLAAGGTRSSSGPAGTSSATGSSARRRSRWSWAPRRTSRSIAALQMLGLGRERVRPRRTPTSRAGCAPTGWARPWPDSTARRSSARRPAT